MDKGIILLLASIGAIVLAIPAFFVIGLVVAIPLGFLGIVGLLSMKLFYRVVKPNEAHVRMFRNRKEVFIAREGQALSYFEFPMIMQVLILPLSFFKTEIENYSFEDKNFAPFKATVVPYFIIADPKIASERVSQFAELRDQLEKIVLSVSRSTMLKYTIREIMSDRQKIGGLIESEISGKFEEFGVSLKNFELVDIGDEEGSKVIKNLNLAEEARIESDSRKVVAEKTSDARLVEATRDEAAQKREIERDRQVGVAQQLKDEEISVKKQDAITAEKMAVQIETIRQKEIDRTAADLEGQAIAVQRIKEAEGFKDAKVLEAEGDSTYIDKTGKAEGDAIAYAGEGKARGILAEAEAMQKYDAAGKYIKELVVKQNIQNAYAKALESADLKAYMTGTPEKGLMGLLTPEGAANVANALSTYNELKGESGGLLDIISSQTGIPKDTLQKIVKNIKKEEPEKKKGKKTGEKKAPSPPEIEKVK